MLFYGNEIYIIPIPRPSHADMGGKQFAIGGARWVNGTYYPSFEEKAEPLLNEFGCLHFKFSILLGSSRPAYSKEQLAQFKAEDNRKFEFEGKEYTRYEAGQLQKRIESEVRRQKDRAVIAKAAGNDMMRREAQYKLNLLTNKYTKLSKESGLPTKMERMKSAVKPLTNGNSGGIIALNRVSSPKNFKPLDVERRNRMFENLRKQGIDIITGEEAIAYLDCKSEKEKEYIEASSLGNMMFFRDNPSASAVFEEIIHLKQSRDGRLLADASIIDELEIEAAQKMIKHQRAYLSIPNGD
ncbi:MAG: hypothetical protein J6A61_02820 [Clostridia bacterium]|nr:hypothetical protein [Clostridia bacterium]